MFAPGSKIKDPQNNVWVVTSTWKYVDTKTHIAYLCLTAMGTGSLHGEMGGARFRAGEAITLRST